jgi:hypothetical protein
MSTNIDKIKAKIELDAEQKVLQLNNNIKFFNDNETQDVGISLLNIIQTGSKEFKEKTGRNMTYSEMREMFG